jgi:hypothetical protein
MKLDANLDAALAKIGSFFVNQSPVQSAALAVARRLSELDVPYAIAGALCLGAYGVVRATEDVDILLTPNGLASFKAAWLGRGYVNLRPGGKAVRDTVHEIKIDFLLTGEYGHGLAAVGRAEARLGDDRRASAPGSRRRAARDRDLTTTSEVC